MWDIGCALKAEVALGGKLRAHWEEVAGTDLLGLGLWCEAAALRAERGAQVGSFVGGFIDGVVHVGWTPASEDEREPFAQTPVHPSYRMGHPPGGQSGGAADVVEHPNCKLGVGLDVDGCGCRHTGETLQDVFGRNSESVELAFVVGTFAQALMDCRRGQEGPSGVIPLDHRPRASWSRVRRAGATVRTHREEFLSTLEQAVENGHAGEVFSGLAFR